MIVEHVSILLRFEASLAVHSHDADTIGISFLTEVAQYAFNILFLEDVTEETVTCFSV